MATLQQYNTWRSSLVSLLEEAANACAAISPERAKLYTFLRNQLRDDTLKIQIVGTVKNGKSSFTNALIGEEVLPVDDIPCTAVVSEVKYSPEKKAVVNFCTPLPLGLIDEIPASTRDYIKKHNMGRDANGAPCQIPPLQIPYDKMSEYVSIPEPTPDILFNEEAFKRYRDKIDQESPYDVAQLFHPAVILKDGIEMVDSPGLNESPKRTIVTLNYLKKADAAIFLLNTTQPVTETDKAVIEEKLLPLGFNDLIMVVNRIDQTCNREKVKLYIQGQMQGYTSNKKIFAVSAKEALEGIKKGDHELLNKSGMPEFMEFLTDYLTRRKAQLKINKTGRQVINSIRKDILDDLIPARLNTLKTDSIAIQDRLNVALPRLAESQAKRNKIANRLDNNIPLALVPIREAINEFFKKLEDQIPQWIRDFKYKTDTSFVVKKSELKAIAEEIINHTKEKVEEEFKVWNENTFQPILNEQSKYVFGDLKKEVEDFAIEITGIETIISGAKSTSTDGTNALERIAGIAAMLFLPMGRAGGDLFSGGFDLSNFFKKFACDIGIGLGVGLVALWIWPPVGFIGTIIGAIIGLLQGNDRKIDKLKRDISDFIVTELRKENPTRVANLLGEVRSTFLDIKQSVIEGIDTEIATVTNQLEEMKKVANNEQSAIVVEQKRLTDTAAELSRISSDISKLCDTVEESC